MTDCNMERPNISSCKWKTTVPRAPMTAFSPQITTMTCSETQYSQVRHQFGNMDAVNGFAETSVQGILSENCIRSPVHCSSPNEDLGLLNIPSIHDTMNTTFEFRDLASQQNSWSECETFGESTECCGDAIGSWCNAERSECDKLEEEVEEEEPSTSKCPPKEPLKRLRRQRANDRERRRMKSLNGALNNLKRCIPLPKTKRRVTKLEILRIACHYIQTLWDTLNNSGEGQAECMLERNTNKNHVVNGMTVTQRLSLLSNNLKFNFQL